MKNLLWIVALIFVVQSCSTGSAENNENTGVSKSTVINAVTVEKKGALHITKTDFLEKVWDYETYSDKWIYKGDKPCIIDFYADWCGPCKIAGPILEELALEYSDQIYVYKIDTEKERELAAAFGIQSIPAFLYCPKDGEPKMAAGIARSKEETRQMFKGVIDDFLLAKK